MSTLLYFFISYPCTKKEKTDDIHFLVPEDKKYIPTCIHMVEAIKNKEYYYIKIFMVNKSSKTGKKANSYYFEFQIDDLKYIISFGSKGATFVYDVKLIKTEGIVQIQKRIHQNILQYYNKMHIFVDALKKNNEENKIDLLYKDTIDLFSIKKGFSFLIELFVEIYKKKIYVSIY